MSVHRSILGPRHLRARMPKKNRTNHRWAMIAASLAVLAMSGLATPARADDFADLDVATAEAMADMRGGFMVNGINFSIGAEIRTVVDGALALATNVTWSQAGSTVVAQAGEGFRIGSDSSAAAVQASDQTGGIRVAHMTAPGDVMNLLVNTESGRFFQQQADFTITLHGFEATQSGFMNDLLGLRLGIDIANALTGRP